MSKPVDISWGECALRMFFAIVPTWIGLDYLFFRNASGQYSYYGFLSDSVMETIFSVLLLVGGLILFSGIMLGRESVCRAGFGIAGIGWQIYGLGFVLIAPAYFLGEPVTPLLPYTFSQLGVGLPFMILGVFYQLAGIRPWHGVE